jgi:hypothetical protein
MLAKIENITANGSGDLTADEIQKMIRILFPGKKCKLFHRYMDSYCLKNLFQQITGRRCGVDRLMDAFEAERFNIQCGPGSQWLFNIRYGHAERIWNLVRVR